MGCIDRQLISGMMHFEQNTNRQRKTRWLCPLLNDISFHFLKEQNYDLHSLKSMLFLIAGEELEQFSGEDLRNQLTRIFSSKDQSEWAEIFDGTDACVTPGLATNSIFSVSF